MPDAAIFERILEAQQNEITEYHIYRKLASKIKDPHNSQILDAISQDELRHHNIWKEYTQRDVSPKRLKIWFFYVIARIFGLSFSIKLMEQGEEAAQVNYDDLASHIPAAAQISSDEDSHEAQLLEMIDEDRFHYVGAIIRGLNEAVVEIMAIITGFTLVITETATIALAGIITGVAMSLSLGATEYLATKAEDGHQHPVKAALYTGGATAFTVALLVAPYFVLPNPYIALAIMLLVAMFIIFFFNYYIAVARSISFWKRFGEMALFAVAIASITFFISWLASNIWHINLH
ncbi:MAG: hypothetical protein JW954_04075 [Dehalococcoidaceae bacterium]|nr:hypothetical protein [Dehalococcoidaceae bacterium]